MFGFKVLIFFRVFRYQCTVVKEGATAAFYVTAKEDDVQVILRFDLADSTMPCRSYTINDPSNSYRVKKEQVLSEQKLKWQAYC